MFDISRHRVETAGEMPLVLAMLEAEYRDGQIVRVVDTNKKWTDDIPFDDLPTKKMATTEAAAAQYKIP